MPSLEIVKEDCDKGIVWFESEDKSFSGTAFKENGYVESHYDVVSVFHFDGLSQKIECNESAIGEMLVTGVVTNIWDDGMFTVEAYGFDFWVSPEEYIGNVKKGQFFKIKVKNFTLYI